jgi:dTDP-4-dehydrorhamnose reductase
MKKALVGYTGFVGSSHDFEGFDYLINSTNIQIYAGKSVDLLVIAAGDARKWFANQNPDIDFNHILNLYRAIKEIKAKHVILYSTVDVIDTNFGVANEDCNFYNCNPYGRNRLLLELLVSQHFPKVQIIRLPGLFGNGLKKNLIYDLKHKRFDQFKKYNPLSKFQFYSIKHSDLLIEKVITSKLPLVHITSETISVEELFYQIAPDCLGLLNNNAKIINYQVETKFPHINPSSFSKAELLLEIMEYVISPK